VIDIDLIIRLCNFKFSRS